MKKALSLILALVLCLSLCACGKAKEVSEGVKSAIIEKCDAFIEEYDYSDTVLYTVENISYTINDIKEVYENEYLVDITWEISISDSCIKQSAWNDDWLPKVGYVLSNETFVNSENGERFTVTHTKEDFRDSVRVSINGNSAYSGNDDYNNAITTLHTCYVCGESGNIKYGSHYYCATHYAMVKTVVEAD